MEGRLWHQMGIPRGRRNKELIIHSYLINLAVIYMITLALSYVYPIIGTERNRAP